jgi:hypothetical protein
MHGVEEYVTVPIAKDSDYLDIRDRKISENFNRKKILNKISEAYGRAPYYKEVYPIIESVINYDLKILFEFICNSVCQICKYLEILTEIKISSTLPIDHNLKGQDKVLALCKEAGADKYINSIGGQELYDQNEFAPYGIELRFLKTNEFIYKQFNQTFIPNLSIIDVLMHNGKEGTKRLLGEFTLI